MAKVRKQMQTKKITEGSLAHPRKSPQQAFEAIVDEVKQVLSGLLTKKAEHNMTSFEKIELVEEGISKKALENLKQQAGLDYDKLASILNVARATLINKKGRQTFNKDLSDKILAVADIYSYGYEVFEDRTRFNNWIFRENQALGGQPPFNLLSNSFGREEVKHLIGRIDHGVYS